MIQCEYCESEGKYRRDAHETLCAECYADWQYCQRVGKEEAQP